MKKRIENDYYPTDAALTKELLKGVNFFPKTSVLEPCYGAGDLAAVLKTDLAITEVLGTDINGYSDFPALLTLDATTPEYWNQFASLDYVITNPPFNAAEKILPLAWDFAEQGVIMLLRLSFLEPTKGRGDWLEQHADNLKKVIFFGQPRPSFRVEGGNDTATTAWFVWEKQFSWKTLGLDSPFKFAKNWKV